MPNDAEKPQILGMQLQRTILNHFLKFSSILAIPFGNLIEIDYIDLAGLLDYVSHFLQGEKHMRWLSLSKCGQKKFDEFSKIGEVYKVILSINELGRRICKRDELSFEVTMHKSYHIHLLFL